MTIANPLNLLLGKHPSSHSDKEVLNGDANHNSIFPCLCDVKQGPLSPGHHEWEMIHGYLLQASPILPDFFFF